MSKIDSKEFNDYSFDKIKDIREIDGTYIHRRYKIGEVLGKGSFGKVYEIERKSNAGEKYAVKCVPGMCFDDESKIYSKLEFKHIVNLARAVRDYYWEGKKKVYVGFIIMEQCYCNLNDFIKKSPFLPRTTEKSIMKQILLGVTYLHGQMVIHRDLKPSNILIKEGVIKIGDFGMCMKDDPKIEDERHVGTLWYQAPEILSGSKHYSLMVDSWSIGCIFLFILIGKDPFQGENDLEQQQMIRYFCMVQKRDFFRRLKNCVMKEWTLTDDQEHLSGIQCGGILRFIKRYFNEQIISKNFLEDLEMKRNDRKLSDLLFRLLEIDPNKRIAAVTALSHCYFFS